MYRTNASHRSNLASHANSSGSCPSAPTMAAPSRMYCGLYGSAGLNNAMANSALENCSLETATAGADFPSS
jgi:hypothetical protein